LESYLKTCDKVNNSNGFIATCTPVTNVDAFYCLQTPDDGHKWPKHVAKNKILINWFYRYSGLLEM
jgi:hypothetical protein